MTPREEAAHKLLREAREEHTKTILWRNTLEYYEKLTITQELRILENIHFNQRRIATALAIIRYERQKGGEDSTSR